MFVFIKSYWNAYLLTFIYPLCFLFDNKTKVEKKVFFRPNKWTAKQTPDNSVSLQLAVRVSKRGNLISLNPELFWVSRIAMKRQNFTRWLPKEIMNGNVQNNFFFATAFLLIIRIINTDYKLSTKKSIEH